MRKYLSLRKVGAKEEEIRNIFSIELDHTEIIDFLFREYLKDTNDSVIISTNDDCFSLSVIERNDLITCDICHKPYVKDKMIKCAHCEHFICKKHVRKNKKPLCSWCNEIGRC